MSHRKRKYRQHSDTYNSQYDQSEGPSPARPDPTLFIVAHEADIIRGPQAARTADSLEVFTNVDGKGGSRIGDGLLKWEGNGDMWVDRYARLSYPSNSRRTSRSCIRAMLSVCENEYLGVVSLLSPLYVELLRSVTHGPEGQTTSAPLLYKSLVLFFRFSLH